MPRLNRGVHPIHVFCRDNDVPLKTFLTDIGAAYRALGYWHRGEGLPDTRMALKIEQKSSGVITVEDLVTYYERVRKTGVPTPNPPKKD